MTADQAFARLRGVQNEMEAARFSVGLATEAVRADPTRLNRARYPVRPAYFAACDAGLEVTYVIRLFAEFEDVCRDYWAAVRPSPGRRRQVRTAVLLDRVAAACRVSDLVLARAHDVRVCRNGIVHDHDRRPSLDLDGCRSRLAKYLAYFPPQW